MSKIDKEALELVEKDLNEGNELTFSHVGSVFGQDFWILLVYAFLDAQDAARAIQGAIIKLSKSEGAEGVEGSETK